MRKIILITLGLFVILPNIAFGQFNMGNLQSSVADYASELTVRVAPSYPKPNETVHLDLEMYTEDLDSSEISWYKDGKLELKGVGAKSFSLQSPSAGVSTNIRISVRTGGGISFSKSFSLRPAGVDLVWEADSYTPPFYKGKALPSLQGAVKVMAVTDFFSGNTPVNPAKLIYKWTLDGRVLDNKSGYGRNIVFLDGDILGDVMEVEVLVTDPATNLTAQSFLNLAPAEPKIVFYENSPLYGIVFEKATKEIDLSVDEVSILSVPYNMSTEDAGRFVYKWKVNNSPVSGLGRLAIFRRPEGAAGSSFISLNVENQNRILQSGQGSFLIKFENNNDTNF